MKHAVLLLWHKNIDQLIRLIQFFDSSFSFYIHMDKKSKVSKDEMDRLRSLKQVIYISRKYKINWGSFQILQAELFLLQEIVKDGLYDYVHFMSGQDYPIKKLEDIKKIFKDNRSVEYIEYMSLPCKQWGSTYHRFQYYTPFDWINYRTERGCRIIEGWQKWQKRMGFKRRIPDQFDYLYGGSNWMSITGECARYLVENRKKNKAFYNRLKYTFAAEETYFPTVILNSPFREKVSGNNLRYIKWKYQNGSMPAILDERDWWSITTSDALFARKFDYNVSDKLICFIETYIFQLENVKITSQGYWDNKTLVGHQYDAALGEGLLKLLSLINVNSIGDFGCGPGWYVALLRENGYEVEGYDGNPYVEETSALFFDDGFYCQCVDLTEDVEVEEPFDIVISLEVGEHLPMDKEDAFLMNLARNAGKYIILSWAIEGQPGDGHINCRSNKYIISKMNQLGFKLDTPASQYLRSSAGLWWFKNTLMFFEKI